MLDLGIGPMHYGPAEDQEINSAWQPGTAPWNFEMVQAGYNAFALANFSSGQIVKYVHPGTGESVAFQPQQLQYTNDLDQIQAIANPQSANAVVQGEDVLFWSGAFGTGFDIRWQTQTARLDKRLVVDQASRWPPPTAQIVAGGNPVARLQFIFQVSNNIDIFVNGVLWNRVVNNPVNTQGYIEFRHSTTGEVLWTFNLPRSNGAPVEDQDPDELLGTFRLRRTGPNLFVEHRIPIAWLQAADYPIEIDTTIDEQVGANSDDAFQATNDGMFLTSQNQLVDATTEHVGLRWTTIALDGTETIDLATVEVTIVDDTLDEPQHKIRGELAPNPGTFTASANDIDARNRTTATVQWNSTNLFASGTDVAYEWGAAAGDPTNGADLSAIVQELIDQGSWATGNAMVMIYEQHTASSTRDLAIRTYDYNTALAAKLHIEYTSGIDADVTEAASAADAPSAVLTTLAGVTEAGAAADSQDAAGSIYSAAVAEAGAAADSPTALLTTLADVAEPAAAADAQSASLLFEDGVSEAVSATDAPIALLIQVGDVSEAGAAADTPSATLTQEAAIVEVEAASDAPSATLTQEAAIVEVEAASDAPSATLTQEAAIVEVEAASDAPSATVSQEAAIAEAGAAAETQSAVLTQEAAVIEAGVALDVQDWALITLVSVGEAAAAADTQDATITPGGGGTIYEVSITEVASAIDTQSATGGTGVVKKKHTGRYPYYAEPPVKVVKQPAVVETDEEEAELLVAMDIL